MISQPGDRTDSRRNYLLLTGATGFVGQYLMRDLLLKGTRLAVLVRANETSSAQARVDSILTEVEHDLGRIMPRPVVLEGDITKPQCGLADTETEWIRDNCSSVLHNAAALRFHASNHADEPWRTNLGGTENVVSLCRQANIRDIFFVSTAYVCGDRPGVIKEDDFSVGQEFRNDYERSKFEAEKIIRDSDQFETATFFRPAVISGDSKTGFTSSYHGLYLYLRLMAMLVPMVEPDENGIRHTDIHLPMTGDEPRNIVPVDWVSEVICHLIGVEAARGKTFHLAPDQRITPRQVVEYGYEYFNSTGVVYEGENGLDCSDDSKTPFEKKFLENIKLYESYDHTDPTFDRTNLSMFAPHLPCPVVDREVMHRYFEFGEANRWGKAKSKPVKSQDEVYEHLEAIRRSRKPIYSMKDLSGEQRAERNLKVVAGENKPEQSFVLGLDLLGPGGGQWHLVGHPDRGYEVRLGLPEEFSPVLHLSTQDFRRMVADRQRPSRNLYRNLNETADAHDYNQIVYEVVQSFVSAPAC